MSFGQTVGLRKNFYFEVAMLMLRVLSGHE